MLGQVATDAIVTSWYRNMIENDWAWIARFKAFIECRPEPQPTDQPARTASGPLYSWCRVSALIDLMVTDYYERGGRRWLRVQENEGGSGALEG